MIFPKERGNRSSWEGQILVAKICYTRIQRNKRRLPIADERARLARASGRFCEKLALFARKKCKNGGPVSDIGQTLPAAAAPRAGSRDSRGTAAATAPPLQPKLAGASGGGSGPSLEHFARFAMPHPGGRGPFLDSFLDRFWVVSRPELL